MPDKKTSGARGSVAAAHASEVAGRSTRRKPSAPGESAWDHDWPDAEEEEEEDAMTDKGKKGEQQELECKPFDTSLQK